LWPPDLCSSFFSEAAQAMLAKPKNVTGTIKSIFVMTEIFMVLTLLDIACFGTNKEATNKATEVQEACRVTLRLLEGSNCLATVTVFDGFRCARRPRCDL
jgi:hypothetical protein